MAYNWDTKALISQMTLPNGDVVYLKDADARAAIDDLSSYTKFLGVTTTALVNGATTNPVSIDGEDVTAKSGDIVIYGAKEFIFNGTAWAEFGDLDALADLLGDLAYNNTASGEYTPQGSVSGDIVGTPATIKTSGAAAGTISVENNLNGNYQPAGTIDASLSTTDATVLGSVVTAGTVPTFSATEATVVGSVVTAGTVPSYSATNATVVGEVTDAGTIPSYSATNATVLGKVTSAGTVPSLNKDLLDVKVSGENLVFSAIAASTAFTPGAMPTFSTTTVVGSTTFNAGAMPTFSNATVVGSTTFDAGAMPTFSDKAVVGSTTFDAGAMPTFSDTTVLSDVDFSSATFTGTKVQIDFSGSNTTFSGSYTPAGTFAADLVGSTATITVSGSVSKPTV